MEYKYRNLKTKKDVTINITKPYVLIYGPNGTGKTTFARYLNNKQDGNVKYLVFDQDFVNNNVYISTADKGYKTDPQNRTKLNQIFLGDSSKEDNEKLNLIRVKKREYNKSNIEFSMIKNEFQDIVIKILENEKYDRTSNKFIMNYLDDNLGEKYIEKIIKELNDISCPIDITKIDDDNYINDMRLPEFKKTYNEDEIKKELLKFLSDSKNNEDKAINSVIDNFNVMLKNKLSIDNLELYLNNIDKITKELKDERDANNLIEKLLKEEKDFIKENTGANEDEIINIQSWIKQGHKIHSQTAFNKCLYCRNDISEELKKEYKSIISNKYVQLLKDFETEIEKINNLFLNLESEYINIEKNNWYYLTKRIKEEKVFKILIKKEKIVYSKTKHSLEKNEYDMNTVIQLEKLKKFLNQIYKNDILKILIKKEEEDKEKNYMGYQLFLKSPKFLKLLKIEIIKKQLNIDEEKISKKIIKDTNEYIDKIRDYVGEFEEIYEPRIKLKITPKLSKKDSGDSTIELDSDEKDFLNQLSEGEKNVLALIIYFSYVKNTINNLKKDESIIMVLDDPVNSNDWNNFFKFRSIIEDYFFNDVKNKKIQNIIILTHNIDYAIIQLQGDKYSKHFELLRLFSSDCEEINTDFLFMDDIKLGAKLLDNLLSHAIEDNNKIYIDKKELLRVSIYMRKFLESFLFNIISISDPNLFEKDEECLEFLKNNTNSDNINNFIEISTRIIKDVNNATISVNDYMQSLLKSINDIISNYNLFKEEAKLKLLISKYMETNKIYCFKNIENQNIIAGEFEIEDNDDYNEVLIDILIKGLITNIKIEENEIVKITKKKAQIYFFNYLRHVNDNVGRPALAENSDRVTEKFSKPLAKS